MFLTNLTFVAKNITPFMAYHGLGRYYQFYWINARKNKPDSCIYIDYYYKNFDL